MSALHQIWIQGWLVVTALTCYAQPLPLIQYTVNEGLVSNSIRRIFQDRQGFLWLATMDGLSKYDGHRFVNFNRANGMPWDVINDMLETENGRLVFACNDGHLVWIHHDCIEKIARPGPVINRFMQTTSGTVMVATDRHGLQVWQNDTLHQPTQPFPSDDYYSLSEINDTTLLAGSGSSVQLLTTSYHLIKRYEYRTPNGSENQAFCDSRGRIWTSHFPGLAQLGDTEVLPLPDALQIEPLSANANIRQIFEDQDGHIWVAGALGLVRIAPDQSVIVFTKKHGLPSDQINCIFQDRESNMWIGTSQGLCKIPAKVRRETFEPHSGVSGTLYATAEEGFLISTAETWYQFDPHQEAWQAMDPATPSRYVTYKNLPGSPPLLTNDRHLVVRHTPEGKALQAFLDPLESPLYHIVKDPDGHYFLSHVSAMYIYDGQHFFRDTTYAYSVYGVVSGLVSQQSGILWIGTWNNGLIRMQYENQNGHFRILHKETLLPGNAIRFLRADTDGTIWAGTRNSGLFRLAIGEGDRYTIRQWTTEQGLSSNWIHHIAPDEKGNIWLAYTYGMDKLVKQPDGDYRIFNFSRVSNFFTTISTIYPQPGGQLWLISENGLMKFRDDEMEKTEPWPVYITRISAGNSIYPPDRWPVKLDYRRNSLRIDFSAPSYVNEKQILYSYRLAGGHDTTWSAPQNLHSVSLASLRPGDYRFEVKTLGWNSQWGPTAVAAFSVSPPFWQRGGFLALSFSGLTAVIIWLVRRRIRFIRQEAGIKQQLAETEMMALRAQMNPHFLFNALNAIDSLIQTRQLDKATMYLGRFARLLRQVLESSKNKLVPFDRDFAAMELYLDMEKFRSSDKFQFDMSADPVLLQGGYAIPPLLVQPFIENAIHHGLMNKQSGGRHLTVTASLEDDFIVFRITDNGVGRARARELNALNRPGHVSYGWPIAIQRLALHHGARGEDFISISDLHEDGMPSGTRVEIKIKVNPQ